MQTISRVWLLCCRRCCKAFLVNAQAPAQLARNIRRREIQADGLAEGDLFGLNKRGNLNLNLRGVGDATGVGVGVADTSAVVFLRTGLGFGEAAGDSVTEGDIVLSTTGVASALLSARRFGVPDSVGVPVSSCD